MKAWSFLALLVIFSIPASAGFISSNDDGLKNLFQIPGNSQNIEVSYAYGGFLFTSTGAHESPITVTVNKGALNSNPKSRKTFNEIERGWHSKDGKIRTPIIIQVTERTRLEFSWTPIVTEYEFTIELSQTCVGCASGITSKTQTGMANGSWINFSLLNGTTATFTVTGLSVSSGANTTFGTVRVDNYLTNGTGIISFNVSNLTGTPNSTHVFMNGNLNSDFSNLNVTMDNTTKLNFWNQTENGTILIQNGFAQIFVNKTINGTAMNVWGGNINTKTSSTNLTFQTGLDFQDNSLPSEFTVMSGSVEFSNGIMKLDTAASWEWMRTEANYNPGSFILSREKRLSNSPGIAGSGFSDGVGANIHDNVNGVAVITGTSNCPGNNVSSTCQDTSGGSGSTYSPNWYTKADTWYMIRNTWMPSYTGLFFNDQNLSYITSNIPTTSQKIEYTTYTSTLEVDYIMVGKVADTSPGTFGALNTVTGASGDVFVYIIPQNHPMSEKKVTSNSSVTGNITLAQMVTNASGLVGFWNFENNTIYGTNIYDLSSQYNNGIWYGNATPNWTGGRNGGSLLFDGVDDYVNINSNLGITNGDITIEAWFKASNSTAITDHPAIVSHYDDGSKVDYRIFQYTTGIGVARHAPTIGWGETEQTLINANQWYHATIVYSGTTLSFYLNGVFQTSITTNLIGTGSYTTQTVIGRGTATAQTFFNGTIDEVRIYNRALNATEILYLYNNNNLYESNSTRPIQNFQIFSNSSSTFTGTITVGFTNNTETLSETVTNGYLIINKTLQLGNDSTKVWVNDTITATTFLNALVKGLIIVTSNNESGRVTTTNNITINTSFPSLPANQNTTINYTIPYDILAVLSQPSNQTINNGSTATHSITITDSTYLNQTITWDFENDGVNDSWGTSVNHVWNTPGNFTGKMYVDTLTTVAGSPDNQSRYFTTNVSGNIKLISPANGGTVTGTNIPLIWSESPSNAPYTYQIATDSGFLGVVASGVGAIQANMSVTATVSLASSTTYWWRAKNSTGAYSSVFTFTTSTPAATPGRFNITVLDEVNLSTVYNYTAQLYNATRVITKATTTGWTNFSSDEVGAGEYLVRIVPNSTYASRSVLAISPNNVTVYLPSTVNTIDTLAFYLLDYTNLFPFLTSNITISKNNSVMHSAYFDADAKVAVYLIRGDSYSITVYHNNNMQQWGNFISTGSGNVEVVLMDIGVNTTSKSPIQHNLSWSNNNITLMWGDYGAVMTSLNYTIFKGSSKSLVHQVITTVRFGQSVYLVTDTNDIYYVYVTIATNKGTERFVQIIEYRAGTKASDWGSKHPWIYGTTVMPDWVYTAFSWLVIVMLAGTFGALHRGEGGIVTSLIALFLWYWGWMPGFQAGASFLVGLVVFAVLYHMENKKRIQGGY